MKESDGHEISFFDPVPRLAFPRLGTRRSRCPRSSASVLVAQFLGGGSSGRTLRGP